MSIDEARFAAAYRLPDGTEKKFDDLGGLIVHARESGQLEDATVWVHDFETEAWVDAPPSSSFVTSSWVTVRITSGPVRNI